MDENSYRHALLVLVETFEYELCGECGGDVNVHAFGPDPVMGLPHAYCLTTPDGVRQGVWPPEGPAGEPNDPPRVQA